MAKPRLSRPNRAYIEQFLKRVETARTQPISDALIDQLLAEMASADPAVRANAVRQICPCRMPWPVFTRLRKVAKQLQHDPDPTVRANALHVEEDARMVASMEGEIEFLREWEDEHAQTTYGSKQRPKYRQR